MLNRLIIFFLFPLLSTAQNTIGLPDIINYSKGTYGGGLQNWDIEQDKNGIIYIANNEGLLSFDGRYWVLYPLPNKTIVRSVKIGTDNRVYVGGQDELGYFEPNQNGKLVYTSLVSFIPEKERAFGDVWDIACLKNDIFFRSASKILKLSGEAFTVYKPAFEWSYMGGCGGQLYAHDIKNGFFHFENGVWKLLVPFNRLPFTSPITAIVSYSADTFRITTLKNGVFSFSPAGFSKISSPAMDAIEQDRVYGAVSVGNNQTALATTNGGVYIVDGEGRLVQTFSKPEGLQNNNVLCIFLDSQQNLWLGLDNGIDFIAYNSAVKRISPSSQGGAGYSAIIHQKNLYAGTSAGVFRVPLQPAADLSFSKGSFSPVLNTSGQTWNLSEVNGQLLLGHHEGAFLIKENIAVPILSNAPGYWNFVATTDVFPAARIIAGNYKGLAFFHYRDNKFVFAGSTAAFTESSRFVAIDGNENVWVSHPYHGVYKVVADSGNRHSAKVYTSSQGLPSPLNNHVYKVKGEVVVGTEKGVYRYNPAKDLFEPSPFYAELIGSQSVRYLKEDADGNIWFIHEKSLGVVDMSAKKPAIIYLPELTNKMLSGFEFIYPVDAANIFIGAEKGFFHINYQKYKQNVRELSVHIRAVRVTSNTDSLLFGGYFGNVNDRQEQQENKILSIADSWKTIQFNYASPLFSQQANLEYSFRLKGFTTIWSEWSKKTEKEYTNLPPGTYTFEVKARNNLGNESLSAAYTFTIWPPWYKTAWAYLFYFLVVAIAVHYFWKWQQKKFRLQHLKYEEEQKRLSYLHQLEIDKAESELMLLRNEKLQVEIHHKNSELATTAMHLVQKGELLTKMKTELHQIMKAVDNDKTLSELKKMIRVLNEDDRTDKDWEHFTHHFDKVHSDFVARLKEKHPTITGNEIKLCAYLRMNLSTKEIAQLMNISARGIEISRYRLRKKIGIASEVSLFEYLLHIE
ncbi:MAG TPA: triple tyrosine motif-containing protein [Flavisolibacter sp.]|nr:triple tyrosine motif-containing protein [Flavisolibacter sp.]